jgi:hypothetical protein
MALFWHGKTGLLGLRMFIGIFSLCPEPCLELHIINLGQCSDKYYKDNGQVYVV